MYKVDMYEMHRYYIDNISRGNYPISLELSEYLYNLCCKIRPRRILDRGSGFSSFVFRKYALMTNSSPSMMTIDRDRWLDIFTVDNKKAWLNKTKLFIRYCELDIANFYIWPDFLKYGHDKKKYDIILDDFHFPDRPRALPKMIKLLAPNGYLILDDANKENYKNAIFKATKRFNISVKYLIKDTGDKSGRYAALIRK